MSGSSHGGTEKGISATALGPVQPGERGGHTALLLAPAWHWGAVDRTKIMYFPLCFPNRYHLAPRSRGSPLGQPGWVLAVGAWWLTGLGSKLGSKPGFVLQVWVPGHARVPLRHHLPGMEGRYRDRAACFLLRQMSVQTR